MLKNDCAWSYGVECLDRAHDGFQHPAKVSRRIIDPPGQPRGIRSVAPGVFRRVAMKRVLPSQRSRGGGWIAAKRGSPDDEC